MEDIKMWQLALIKDGEVIDSKDINGYNFAVPLHCQLAVEDLMNEARIKEIKRAKQEEDDAPLTPRQARAADELIECLKEALPGMGDETEPTA